MGIADGAKAPLLAIGEAKWGEIMGKEHLDRLQRIRSLIAQADRYDTAQTRLVCFSGTGFTSELRALAEDSDVVQLVDLNRLYAGT